MRKACVDKNGMKKGAWSEEEDEKLRSYILTYGHWNWRLLPKFAGLARCGKSCRLRWINYLRPGLKRGTFTTQERHLVAKLHDQLGKKWSAMAARIPGRTDNEIKNFWHTQLKKRTTKKTTPTSPPMSQSSSQITNINNVVSHQTCDDHELILESSGALIWDSKDTASSSQTQSMQVLSPEEQVINAEKRQVSLNDNDIGDHDQFLPSFWTDHPFMVDTTCYSTTQDHSCFSPFIYEEAALYLFT